MIAEKRHRLTVCFPDHPVRFVADPTRIEQILGNLLTNAAKYTEPGGASRGSAGSAGDEIVFRVRDTGRSASPPRCCRRYSASSLRSTRPQIAPRAASASA